MWGYERAGRGHGSLLLEVEKEGDLGKIEVKREIETGVPGGGSGDEGATRKRALGWLECGAVW